MSYEAQFHTAIRHLVREGLADERSLMRVFEIVELAGATAQRATERAERQMPPPTPIACAKGCAWCCYFKVAVTPAEAFRLAAFLRETLSEDALSALVQRMIETVDRTRGLTRQAHSALGLPCPLLQDDACSVHPLRPLSCRGQNSLNVRPCEEYHRHPQGQIAIPVYAPQAEIAGGIRAGLSDGLEAVGLQGELRELVSALLTALTVPDAAARWLTGERVFSDAPPADKMGQTHKVVLKRVNE